MQATAELAVNGKNLTLLFDINALCDLEEETDKSFPEIIREMTAAPTGVSMRMLRALLWAGLRANHPEVDIGAAGRIISECGGVLPALEKIAEAFAKLNDAQAAKVARSGTAQTGGISPVGK